MSTTRTHPFGRVSGWTGGDSSTQKCSKDIGMFSCWAAGQGRGREAAEHKKGADLGLFSMSAGRGAVGRQPT